MKTLTNDDLIILGFKPISHFTIGNTVTYDLGRNRCLSASGVGSFNEFLYISQRDDINDKIITDLICLHNYDYDGHLSIEKIKSIISALS